ncbi:nucleotidyltransferase family protein [Enterococcus sp. LJL90]
MIYSKQEILDRCLPIFEKYEVATVYLFGSYARGEATSESDIDFLIDSQGSKIKNIFDTGDFREELEKVLNKSIDVVKTGIFQDKQIIEFRSHFLENLRKEKVLLYQK